MHLIKVNAIPSTNSFVREMFKENSGMPITCVVAHQQLQGRGQRGTAWESKAGQNLTFSLLLPKPGICLSSQFLLSAVVSTSLIKVLGKFKVPRLKVKWPNDIMAGNFKIGGVLIENIVNEGALVASVIGIGLNVNQEVFPEIPQAGSLKMLTGKKFSLEEILQEIMDTMEVDLNNLEESHAEKILQEYKENLFRFNMPSTFQFPDKTLFLGIIEGVSLSGKLKVNMGDHLIREFDLKEIKLCF